VEKGQYDADCVSWWSKSDSRRYFRRIQRGCTRACRRICGSRRPGGASYLRLLPVRVVLWSLSLVVSGIGLSDGLSARPTRVINNVQLYSCFDHSPCSRSLFEYNPLYLLLTPSMVFFYSSCRETAKKRDKTNLKRFCFPIAEKTHKNTNLVLIYKLS
jgi:hypothetical protein